MLGRRKEQSEIERGPDAKRHRQCKGDPKSKECYISCGTAEKLRRGEGT
jgi:hypothetical protein